MIGLYLWVPLLLGVTLAGSLFRYAGFELPLAVAAPQATLALLGMLSWVVLTKRPGTRRIGIVVNAFYQLGAIGGLGMMLAYAAATTGRPLVDGALLGIDRALHYDWQAYAGFFVAHPAVAMFVLVPYFTLMMQPMILILVLSAGSRAADLEKFVLASFVTMLLTTGLFALYPATTAWAHLGLPDAAVGAYRHLPLTAHSWVSDLLRIRAGGGRTFAEGFGSAIIAFPSLHCASGVLYAWAAWRVKWLRLPMLGLNGLMIAATPVVGGHYLSDLIGGAAVAAVAIALVRRIYPGLAASAERRRAAAAPLPVPQLAWSSPAPGPAREEALPAKAA